MATPAHRFHGTFGEDTFGQLSERAARLFGTPQYIVGQTILVIVWMMLNSLALSFRWYPYPFILLNLAFSTQAAYAAPLILLAETRQTARDKAHSDALEERHARIEDGAERRLAAIRTETRKLEVLLESNTQLTQQDKELTEQVVKLTREMHAVLTRDAK